ncbi:MAG: ROK family protein [Erysipelotrichaceae bacterium]|nr:ROK family protein [Erysipelotrichaceae bacterium]
MKLMAFDVGGTEIKYSLMDDDLNVYDSGYVDTPHDSFEHFAQVIYDIYEPHKDECEGIAMSLPGFIDVKKGRCNGGGALFYNHGTDVAPLLEEKCGYKVVLENDGKAAAKAEYYKGSLQGCKNAAVFVIGTAVGGGLIIDGKVVKGRHFTAGEFSFLSTSINDFENPYSHMGTVCSTRGLLEMYKRAKGLEEEINGRQFFALLNEDETAKKVLDEFASGIAKQIYNLYWLLDLEKVAIGGGISRQPILIEKVNEQFNHLIDDSPVKQYLPVMEVDIVAAQFGNEANQIGAFMTFVEENG